MKIEKIKIENIASIEQAEIDFVNGPLAIDPLFLITGETGSGKSTILNTICLALYNKVPALYKNEMRDNDHEGIKNNDPVQLMRKGTGYAEVILNFEGNDGKHYVATWIAQRAHKKPSAQITKSSPARTLRCIEDDEQLTRVGEIDSKIKDVVGLTFDQFTRTTMLAQGQFATFMKASPTDKAEILEKLTGTEIYATIGKKIFERLKERESQYQLLATEINALAPLSQEQRDDLLRQIADFETQISASTALTNILEQKINWIKQDTNLSRQYTQQEAQYTKAKERANSEETNAQRLRVKQWNETTKIRQLIAEKSKATARLQQLKEQIQTLTGEDLSQILDGIQWLKEQHTAYIQEIDQLKHRLDDNSKFISIINAAQRIQEMARSVESNLSDANVHQQTSNNYKAKATKSKETEGPIEKAQNEITEQFNQQTIEVNKLKLALDETNAYQIAQDIKEKRNRTDVVKESISAINQYNEAKEQAEKSEKSLAEAQTHLNSASEALDKCNKALPEAKERHKYAEGMLKGYMDLNDHINSLRERFAQTEVCPLCGTHGVHLHAEKEIDDKLKELKEAEAKAKQALETLQDEISKNTVIKKEYQQRVTRETKDNDNIQSVFAKAKAKVDALVPDYTGDSALDNLNNELNKLTKSIEQLETQLSKATKTQEKYKSEDNRLNKLRDDLTKIKERLTKQQENTKQCEESAKTEARLASDAKKRAEDAFSAIKAIIVTDGEEILDALTALIAKKHEDFVVDITNTKVLIAFISNIADEYSDDKEAKDKKEKDLQTLTATIEHCQKSIDEITQRFAKAYEPKAINMSNIEVRINQLITHISRIDGGIMQQNAHIKELCNDIDAYYAESQYTPDQIEKISLNSEQQIASDCQDIKDKDDALAKSESALNVIKQQRASHLESKPEISEEDIYESLCNQKEETLTLRDNTTKAKVEAETIIKQDNEKVEAIKDKRSQADALKLEINNWEQLNRIFGSADGHLFRNIAQSYVLRALLVKSNYYLDMLSPRYKLDCEDGSLTINVIDNHHGGSVRNVGLLSGGESFIVSLALALGLSAISKESLNVDTLFIDEGFGSLDHETLETVINTLDRLHQIGGRRIGIISHIADLKERINTQITLRRTGPSTSRIEVHTL